jgi:2-octaprenylphenol hydroxylase
VNINADVVVVGAGMVGACAALALARKGFSVAVIERQVLGSAPFPMSDAIDLRVSAISPVSQQLLGELGVWQEIRRERSCDYEKMFIWHENGNSIVQFASEMVGIPHLGTIVENQLIQSVILQQLRLLNNVSLLDGQQLIAVSKSDETVKITTSDQQQVEAQLLIAADGRESAVRDLLHLPAVSGSYQQKAIVANVSTEKPHEHTAWQRFLSTGPLAFLPLCNGQSSIVWSADDERARSLMQLTDDEFCQALAEAFEFRLGAVTECSQRAAFNLSWHSAQQWLKDRVLLIGDAAHGVHPLAGQGVNLGFADVALLSSLIEIGHPVYNKRLLRRFERQRKAEAVTAMHLFSMLKQLYGQQNSLVCLARDIGMSVVETNTLIKRIIMNSAIQNMA